MAKDNSNLKVTIDQLENNVIIKQNEIIKLSSLLEKIAKMCISNDSDQIIYSLIKMLKELNGLQNDLPLDKEPRELVIKCLNDKVNKLNDLESTIAQYIKLLSTRDASLIKLSDENDSLKVEICELKSLNEFYEATHPQSLQESELSKRMKSTIKNLEDYVLSLENELAFKNQREDSYIQEKASMVVEIEILIQNRELVESESNANQIVIQELRSQLNLLKNIHTLRNILIFQ